MSESLTSLLAWIILFALVAIAVYVGYQQNKKAEEKRLNEILEHKSEWGETMCQWLIENKYKLSDQRTQQIMSNFQTWGQERCKTLLLGKIEVGMTTDMVTLSVGKPNDIDNKEITEKDEKYRYIYGTPRQGATYVWFKNGKVTKIKQ